MSCPSVESIFAGLICRPFLNWMASRRLKYRNAVVTNDLCSLYTTSWEERRNGLVWEYCPKLMLPSFVMIPIWGHVRQGQMEIVNVAGHRWQQVGSKCFENKLQSLPFYPQTFYVQFLVGTLRTTEWPSTCQQSSWSTPTDNGSHLMRYDEYSQERNVPGP